MTSGKNVRVIVISRKSFCFAIIFLPPSRYSRIVVVVGVHKIRAVNRLNQVAAMLCICCIYIHNIRGLSSSS